MILDSNTQCNINFGDHLCHQINNLKSYKYTLCHPSLSIETHSDFDIQTAEKSVYFICDAPGEDAFAHWFYESFIFYPIIKELYNQHPNLKIITINTKRYVKNLFDFVGLDTPIINTIENTNNTCYIPPIISLNDTNINLDLLGKYINMHKDYINSLSNSKMKNNITLFPRQTTDNYQGNDRIMYGIDDIKKNISNIGGLVVDTYELNSIIKQYEIINNSKIIILDWGSSYFVNGMHAANTKIIVLDNYGWICQCRFPAINFLHESIKKNNNVIIVHPKYGNTILYDNIKLHL
jgi:hypothetical protein